MLKMTCLAKWEAMLERLFFRAIESAFSDFLQDYSRKQDRIWKVLAGQTAQLNRIERQLTLLELKIMALDLTALESGLAGLTSAIAAEKEEVKAALAELSAKVAELNAIVAAGFQPSAEDLAKITALGTAIAAATSQVSDIVATPVIVPAPVEEVIAEVVESPENPLTPAEAEVAIVSETVE